MRQSAITPVIGHTKKILTTIFMFFTFYAKAQEIKIPMQPSSWTFDSSRVEFVKNRDVPAIKGKNGAYYEVFLKDKTFSSGTIEFDVELLGQGFPGINFRMSPDKQKGEVFYIRSFGPVTPEKRTTVQYSAIVGGISIWDLSDEYQSGAVINQTGWNHVKLVISGKQMRAYVNDMSRPVLAIPELEGETETGNISLSGNVVYANLVLKPNITEGLPAQVAFHSTYSDTRYIRNWQLSPAKDFPFGKDIMMPLPSMHGKIQQSDLPDSTTVWTPIQAENRAIVNLTRRFGSVKDDGRRLAWLKTTIIADKPTTKKIHVGFSDELWVFVNGAILYQNKNYFGMPEQINDGRCVIENCSFTIPLKEGKNEILIGLANYFFGWGMIARMDDLDGIRFQ